MSLASTEYQRRWRAKKRQAEIAAGLRPPPKKAATSTERSRRYRAKLKAAATQAPAQDSTGLRQENAALWQLEKELAQQRATAKPAQQEGPAMRALMAAMNEAEVSLRRQLNSIKRAEFPWIYDATKCAMQEAIFDLGMAFRAFMVISEVRSAEETRPRAV
jgi:hypothetical protein